MMDRTILIKTNTKHSIPQPSSFYVPSPTTLAHLQRIWLINVTASFFLPHLTGWVLKHWRHAYIVQYTVLQQNTVSCQDTHAGCGNYITVTASPKVSTQTSSELWKTALHIPQSNVAQESAIATHITLKKSLYKEHLIWCFFSFSICFLHHLSLGEKNKTHTFNRSNATYRCNVLYRYSNATYLDLKPNLYKNIPVFAKQYLQDKAINLITNRNKIICLMKKDKDQLWRNGDYKTHILYF